MTGTVSNKPYDYTDHPVWVKLQMIRSPLDTWGTTAYGAAEEACRLGYDAIAARHCLLDAALILN
jgi:hypothetical protein